MHPSPPDQIRHFFVNSIAAESGKWRLLWQRVLMIEEHAEGGGEGILDGWHAAICKEADAGIVECPSR